MKYLSFTIIFVLCIYNLLKAQEITIQPYLQDASPNSMFILWETNTGSESFVEWGLTSSLGNTKNGTDQTTLDGGRVHQVKLDGLKHFTKYFYRVKTGRAVSEIFNFKTAPYASENKSFRMVVMSDMQSDMASPNKFNEIIHNGILDYFKNEFGGAINDELAFVLIPGDLVGNGRDYLSWEESFFEPSEDLFHQIPFYPVLGNHEFKASYYFDYFKLPENGSAGFKEHWWYKDFGNVRIIGLDSNSPYRNIFQLKWLKNVLKNTCSNDSVDFVFAQLHHPYKSELWTSGESSITGDIVNLLEDFTVNCGKPSIHFFGHTHGYSRGNSRDQKHLWLNVATAGGSIDNWGEFSNKDYDEFSVSQDEYGFVLLEVTSDADPKIVIKRISRGDHDLTKDNIVTDSLIIKLYSSKVNTPLPVFPVNEVVTPKNAKLKANNFSAPDKSALHGQSHWQVSYEQNNFTRLAAESWKNFENWYFDKDTQLGDDLTDEIIVGLVENTSYWWRVRYRDRELNWSDWSSPVSFSTGIVSGIEEAIPTMPVLMVFPNPVTSTGTITLTKEAYTNLELFVVNSYGSRINIPVSYNSNIITIETLNLAPGIYFFSVSENSSIIGIGKFLVL